MLRTPYSANAYRLLGLPATATAGEVRARAQHLRLASEVGRAIESAFDGRWLSDDAPSSDAIRMAASRAQDPKADVVDRALWFWVTDEADERAAAHMARGALQSAEQIWRRRAQTAEGPLRAGAMHNLAVLLHARSLHCDEPELAQEALQLWSQLLAGPDLLSAFPSRGAGGPQAVASDEELRAAREGIAAAVLTATAAAARDALDAVPADGRAGDAHEYIRAILESGLPSRLVRTAGEEACEAEVGRADAMATSAVQKLREALGAEDDATDWQQVCDDAFAEMSGSAQKLQRLSAFGLADAGAVRAAGDKVALSLRELVLASLFRARDVAMSRAALALAEELAQREATRAELAKAENDLREQGEGIEFCDEAESRKAYVRVEIEGKESVRVPPMCTCCMGLADSDEAVGYSWEVNYIVYRRTGSVWLNFPVCSACKEHARARADRGCWLRIALPMGAGVLLAGLLFSVWRGAPPVPVFLISLLAAIPAYVVYYTRYPVRPLPALGPEHASRTERVQMSKDRSITTFVFANARYGLTFARANGVPAMMAGRQPDDAETGAFAWVGHAIGSLGTALAVLFLFCIAYPMVSAQSHERPQTTARAAPASSMPAAEPQPAEGASWSSVDSGDSRADVLRAEMDSERPRLRQMESELQSLGAEIESSTARLHELESQLRQMEAGDELGLDLDRAEYERLLHEHDSLVAPHNERVRRAKALVDEYHAAVSNFNAKFREYKALARH